MIHVSQLTKYYGDYPAVRDVSFDVAAGQIVGFLGPNGAGKTTTMRILAGYLTATSGKATIAGLDVFWDPVEVRRKHRLHARELPALQRDARRRVPASSAPASRASTADRRKQRIDYVLERCWLSDVQPADHRHAVEGLSPARRPGRRAARRPAGADPRRADRRPRPDADPLDARADPRAGPGAHDPAVDAHPAAKWRATCRQRHHHPPRPGRRRQLARGVCRTRRCGRRRSMAVFDGVVDGATLARRARRDDADRRSTVAATTLQLRTPPTSTSCARAVASLRRERAGSSCELRIERPTLEDLFVQITRSGVTVSRVDVSRRLRRGSRYCGVGEAARPRRIVGCRHHGEYAMRPTLSLIRREFSAYFLSPIAYVVLAVFLAVTGHLFYLSLDQLTAPGPRGIAYPMQLVRQQRRVLARLPRSSRRCSPCGCSPRNAAPARSRCC